MQLPFILVTWSWTCWPHVSGHCRRHYGDLHLWCSCWNWGHMRRGTEGRGPEVKVLRDAVIWWFGEFVDTFSCEFIYKIIYTQLQILNVKLNASIIINYLLYFFSVLMDCSAASIMFLRQYIILWHLCRSCNFDVWCMASSLYLYLIANFTISPNFRMFLTLPSFFQMLLCSTVCWKNTLRTPLVWWYLFWYQ